MNLGTYYPPPHLLSPAIAHGNPTPQSSYPRIRVPYAHGLCVDAKSPTRSLAASRAVPCLGGLPAPRGSASRPLKPWGSAWLGLARGTPTG